MGSMSGPKKIIDLDSTPESQWTVESNATHIYSGKLWASEVAGCVLCVEAERHDAKGQTLRDAADEHLFVCLTHGPLEEVSFLVRRDFVIKIGKFEKTGFQEVNDTILIPKSLSEDERQGLYARLVEAAADAEQKEDLLADD
jgi:hypothetical protein